MTTIASSVRAGVEDGPAAPLDELRALHRAGALTDGYARVAPLVTAIAAGAGAAVDLPRAGQLLSRLDEDAVLAAAAAAGAPVDVVTVAVTGHSTLGNLVAPLTAELARHGMLLRPRLGEFDSYLRDLGDPDSPFHAADVDLALCVLDPQVILDELPSPWAVEDLEQVAAAKLAQLEQLADGYLAHGPGTLVLNTVPLLRATTAQLVDLRSRAVLGAAWRDFNAGLLRLSTTRDRLVVLDTAPLLSAGVPVAEPRMASYAKVNLGDELLAGYAREVGHLARMVRGRTKKVLVVDADNTLWDGVLGDDGPDGIAAATTFRGEAFGNFQRVVRQVGSQGVLLAVSSKNDSDAVLQVLREHPDMALRDTDFAAVNANWEPKDGNLRAIAARLNLGLDSLVFVDDSPFECGLVTSSLPEVAVVRLDDEPALHVERLLADGWFDCAQLTAEDRARAGQYRAEAARLELSADAGSMEEYLARLGVVVTVTRVKDHEVARVAQLSLRTNQFNLTTRRLGPDDVAARVADPDQLVLSVRSADRFGDNGVVGAVFAGRDGDRLDIENMLLSCRVFARGIEQTVLAAVLAHAAAAGFGGVRGHYRLSPKNARVRAFYPSVGFSTVSDDAEGATFAHDLADLPAVPDHVRLETDLPGVDPAPRPSDPERH